jgi:hypothetical protein
MKGKLTRSKSQEKQDFFFLCLFQYYSENVPRTAEAYFK